MANSNSLISTFALFSLSAVESDYVTVNSGRFELSRRPYRFIGANMYELAYTDRDTCRRMLEEAAGQGFNAVRFWAFASVKPDMLEHICEVASALNIRIVPVLADMNEFLQGFRIDDKWFRKSYTDHYLPFVISLMQLLESRKEILMWELFNEPACSDISALRNFIADVSRKAKDADKIHPLTVGTIGGIGDRFGNEFSRFSLSNFRSIYSVGSVDAVSLHDYSFSATFLERADLYFRLKSRKKTSFAANKLDVIFNAFPDLIDEVLIRRHGKTLDIPFTVRSIWKFYNNLNILAAKKLDKPVFIGEIGIKKKYGALRSKILESQLRDHFDSGVSGAFVWSFEAEGRSLDGHDYGFNSDDGFGDVARRLLTEYSGR